MHGPRIRVLLLGANLMVLLLPLSAIGALRLYDVALLRQTERQLIAESVLIGEAYRDAYVRLGGAPLESYRPPSRREERYTPIEPVLDVGTPVLEAKLQTRPGSSQDALALQTARAIEPLMRRAQTFNLSGVRVLDAAGCVLATTRSQEGECLERSAEVRSALQGRYAAAMRQRISDEAAPPLGDVRRRGSVRVFTALPIWHNGRVIAVVTASRTGLDALSSLWQNRRELVLAAAAVLALTLLATLLFAWLIARPLERLTAFARATVRGEPGPPPATRFMPSEIAVLADALHEMKQRLQQRADDAARRAADASHELKTPIAAMRGAIELVRDGEGDMPREQRERFIANIDADAERIERLVTRMLTLARIESEASKAADLLDVGKCAGRLLARFDDVQLQVEGSLGSLAIREEHLASVVLNLVDNARRHGAEHPVEVRLRREGERVCVEVSDQGPGISPSNRTRVFERFFTTERDRGGTGLGLSIVKAVAEARGGRVAFETSERGTTFRVWL